MADKQLNNDDIDFDLDIDDVNDGDDDALFAEKDGLHDDILDESHQGEGILIYNGRKYAVGLVWLMGDEGAEPGFVYKRAKSFLMAFQMT